MDLGDIDRRLERIEDKLDSHLDRVSRVEEAVSGMRGNVRILFSLVLAGISAVVTAIAHSILGR